MIEDSTKFGFLPERMDISCGPLSIGTLEEASEAFSEVQTSDLVYRDWICAPPDRSRDFISGEIKVRPFLSRVFALPKTHYIHHSDDNDPEHINFLVWCLGFFLGLRLTTTEAGFLDATPIKTGKLNDFLFSGAGPTEALMLAEQFWQSHGSTPRATKRVAGIIHGLFLGQNPNHLPFERFTYFYMALDSCFALAKDLLDEPTGRLSHAERFEWMCRKFDMPVPDWANPNAQKKTEISVVRNDTMHEALFFGEPLGFTVYGGVERSADSGSVLLQMQALICRLLVALLGKPEATYVRSPVDTRQRFLLDLS